MHLEFLLDRPEQQVAAVKLGFVQSEDGPSRITVASDNLDDLLQAARLHCLSKVPSNSLGTI